MGRTTTLTASAEFGHGGKQFVARVTGRHPKFTFAYEFLGRREGKRGESTSVEVDDSGLYVERDIDRKGDATDSFFVIWRDGEEMQKDLVERDEAMAIARKIGDHKPVDFEAIGRSAWLAWLRSAQEDAAQKDPEEMITLRFTTASTLGLDPTEKHLRRETIARRQAIIDRLSGASAPVEAPIDLSAVSTKDLRAELARRVKPRTTKGPKPSVKVIPFDEAQNVTSIGLRLAPLDVGFDLRSEGVAVAVPADTTTVSYADSDGARYVVEGSREEIVRVLRDAGYRISDATTDG